MSSDFDCAGAIVRVDPSLVENARPRVHLAAFQVTAGDPALTIRRHATLAEPAQVAEGPLGRCRFVVTGDRLDVEVNDGAFPAELVLRLAWYLVTTRRGGVLLHASALSDGTHALVACGKSGDGKSTLSRLCARSGLALLTDEIVQIFPEGTCAGSPFRSDEDNVGRPGRFAAKHFVALRKADLERLEPLSAIDAGQLATSQCFDGSVLALPKRETRHRLLSFLSHPRLGTLAFRKDEAVGGFVRALLEDAAAPVIRST